MMIDLALPLTIGALALVILYDLRRRSAERHRAELQHIRSSEIFLQAHGSALRAFIAADAPDTLKSLLLEFSDVLADRVSVLGIAHLISRRRKDERARDPLIDELNRLPPELMRAFAAAVLTGTMAGLLRWPETASEFEQLAAELFAHPDRDVATVANVSRFRRSGVVPNPAFA